MAVTTSRSGIYSFSPATSSLTSPATTRRQSYANENKAIIRRLIDEVWNQRRLEIVEEIVAPDAVIHSPTVPDLSRGPEGAKQYSLFWTAFPNLKVTTDDMVAEGIKWHSAGQLAVRTRGG